MAQLCCRTPYACVGWQISRQWGATTSHQASTSACRRSNSRCNPRPAAAQLGPVAAMPAAAAAAADLRGSTQQLLESSSQRLQALQLPQAEGIPLQLPEVDRLQLPSDIDASQAAASVAQALDGAAQGVAAAAQRALAPLDVFSGNILLDVMFWACLLLVSYSVIVLGPRQ